VREGRLSRKSERVIRIRKCLWCGKVFDCNTFRPQQVCCSDSCYDKQGRAIENNEAKVQDVPMYIEALTAWEDCQHERLDPYFPVVTKRAIMRASGPKLTRLLEQILAGDLMLRSGPKSVEA
jgi:hypothetical protein